MGTSSVEAPTASPFVYELPEDRIAQRPSYPYDSAKLLRVQAGTASGLEDRVFSDLPLLLRKGDLLILNNSVVRPARFFGKLSTGGNVELLLVGARGPGEYEAIARPMRKLEKGTKVAIDADLTFEVLRRVTEKTVIVAVRTTAQDVALDARGVMPIPPYIRGGKGDERDRLDYQSRFAGVERNSAAGSNAPAAFGSIAAPTASLHFTDDLVARLEAIGVARSFVTLDVGLASVLPVVQEDGSVRPPGEERLEVPSATIEAIARTRTAGGRVVAVGTTVVRALESYALNARATSTEIFIRPGHLFKNVDWVITNFHQPGSSHLLLVEALIGAERLAAAYQHALRSQYRFLSYGDAMIIER